MSVRFKVPDMACRACSVTITEAITTLDPTAKVDADLKTKWFGIEAQVDEASLRAAISGGAMAFSSVSVVTNALRSHKFQPKPISKPLHS
jgi:copper chaperone